MFTRQSFALPALRRRLRWAALVLMTVAAGCAALAGCTTLDEQQRRWIF